jgi:predicted lipid-binding transport protein (Tim44 family)
MFGFLAAMMLLAMVIAQTAAAGMILGMTGFAGIAAWAGSRVFRLSERLRDLDAAQPGAQPENSLNDDGQALLPEASVEAEPQPPAAPPEAGQGGRMNGRAPRNSSRTNKHGPRKSVRRTQPAHRR